MNKARLDLEDLRVFIRVAELGHFSHAAEHLELPKARVSQRIAHLETHLGTRLFQRSTRRVSLTPDGQALLERARALLDDAGELEELFEQNGALRGRLRVDLPVRLAVNLVVPALPQLLARHPQLHVELSTTDRRVDLVEEAIDCVLRIGNLHDPLLVARRLGEMRQITVASPDYLQRRGVPRSLEDLSGQGHELVHYAPRLQDTPPLFEWRDGATTRTVQLPARVTVCHTEAYEAAALAGLGLIQAPALGLDEHLKSGRLQRVLADCEVPALPVHLVYAQRRHQPRRVREFMAWLTGLLQPRLDS